MVGLFSCAGFRCDEKEARMEAYEVVQFFLKAIILAAVAFGGVMAGIAARKRKNKKEGQE